MANNESRKLMVDVVARIDKLEKAMKRGAQVTDQQMGKVEKRARTMVVRVDKQFTDLAKTAGKGFLAGFATIGVGGIAAAVQNVTRSFADLGREAKTAGVNVEDFQRWRYVADQNRIGIDAMIDGFKELNLRADEYVATGKGSAAESFQRIGMSPAEVKERIKDPSAFMLELIDRTRRLKDTAAGVRIFDELLGGSGGEQFVRLIEQGRSGISATIDEANKMGIVFDESWIKRAEEIDRKFLAISTTVGVTLKTAIVDAVSALQGFISQWNDLNSKSVSGITAELDLLSKRKAQLEKQSGTTEDSILGIIGKDAATELGHVSSEMERLNGELQRRKDIVLTTPEQPPVKPIIPPDTKKKGKSDEEKARDKATKAAERERKAVTDLIADLQFEASLVGKTAVEKEKMIALRHAGAAATDAERKQIEQLVETTYKQTEAWEANQQRLLEINDTAREATGSLIQGMLNGENAAQSLANALGNVADRLLNDVLDAIFQVNKAGGGGILGGLLGMIGGGGSVDPWAGLRGFDRGGYTGPGGVKQPAGVVHKGEVVWSQNDVRKAGGVGTVEAMRRGVRGYDVGGAPGLQSFRAPAMPVLQAARQPKEVRVQPQINISIAANGDETIRALVMDGVNQGLRQYDKSGPMRFARDSKQVSRRGLVR